MTAVQPIIRDHGQVGSIKDLLQNLYVHDILTDGWFSITKNVAAYDINFAVYIGGCIDHDVACH